MENRSRGALLSFVLLVLGSTLLPEPCDAWPRGYRSRNSRNAAPEPRCPNCARDCPQNLAGDSISESNDDYQSVQYSPGPHISYDALPPSTAYNPPSQALSSYNPAPVPAPIPVPAPAVASYSTAPTAYNPQVPTETFSAPLPAPSYDPRLPSVSYNHQPSQATPPTEQPCYNCPPAAPAPLNLLPKPHNRLPPWRRPSKFSRSPYALQEYRQHLYPQESNAPSTECDCDCGCDPVHELDDDNSYATYNRRSIQGENPRVMRHYNQAHRTEAQNPPSEMYKTYVPYVRDEAPPNESAAQYVSDENDHRGRERLYVVYRADAASTEQQSSEDHSLTERELETVIRKAIEIARQERNQDNELRKQVNRQYQIQQRQESGSQRAQRQWPPAPARTDVTEYDEESANPGLDQNKWIAISAVPAIPAVPISEIISNQHPNAGQWTSKAPEVKHTSPETLKTVSVDLLGDMEPQTPSVPLPSAAPAVDTNNKKT